MATATVVAAAGPTPDGDGVNADVPGIESGKRYIRIASRSLSTATMNSLRRVLVGNTECLGFTEHLDQEEYPFFRKYFKLDLRRERNTVVTSTSRFAIPVISHRLARIPIYTDEETRALLLSTETRKVFFVICAEDNYTKPLHHLDPVERQYTSRDLTPVVFIKNTEGAAAKAAETEAEAEVEYVYDAASVDQIKRRMQHIFQYDCYLICLQYGTKLHAILTPTLGVGIDDPRWIPCTYRYRFNRDPRHDAPIRLHKQPDYPGIRMQFAQMPEAVCKERGLPVGSTYDRFQKPWEIELMAIYNGRMDPKRAVLNAIDVLKRSLDLFLLQYYLADEEEQSDDEQHAGIIHKEMKDRTQLLYVPYNTNDKLDDEYKILAGHTIGNLLASKMLYMIDRDVIKDDMALYEGTMIAYRVPHHLVQQCLYTIQLPLDNELFKERFAAAYGEIENVPAVEATEIASGAASGAQREKEASEYIGKLVLAAVDELKQEYDDLRSAL